MCILSKCIIFQLSWLNNCYWCPLIYSVEVLQQNLYMWFWQSIILTPSFSVLALYQNKFHIPLQLLYAMYNWMADQSKKISYLMQVISCSTSYLAAHILEPVLNKRTKTPNKSEWNSNYHLKKRAEYIINMFKTNFQYLSHTCKKASMTLILLVQRNTAILWLIMTLECKLNNWHWHSHNIRNNDLFQLPNLKVSQQIKGDIKLTHLLPIRSLE